MLVICSRFVRAESKLVHNMFTDQSFFAGKIYTSVDDVKKDIDVYNEINFTNFVVSMNNKQEEFGVPMYKWKRTKIRKQRTKADTTLQLSWLRGIHQPLQVADRNQCFR